MEYFLMRKDDVITLCDFTPEGEMISFRPDYADFEKAPIFDSGRSMGARGVVPYTEEEIDEIEVNSFESSEKKLLELVRGANDQRCPGSYKLIDISKLPDPEFIREMYQKDTKISPRRIEAVVRLYEIKISRLKDMM